MTTEHHWEPRSPIRVRIPKDPGPGRRREPGGATYAGALHLQAPDLRPLCQYAAERAGEDPPPRSMLFLDVEAYLMIEDPAKVDCAFCLEWMRA